ncbi:uncharacterized protein LMH87_009044 [Akanthomyces muscarius]|uniref:Uncharacterized protein n=1 Tax=Akanthomyces muscarius TaxID=2231603 RepID=A0A9W8QHH8_AKAMU|nr:uncharacterized protein LMH87_009044 [Akanthomyces muscarius]KAJ4158521.1 hypothetical protein LMH87_009044 [Akanthomyces muscarius]
MNASLHDKVARKACFLCYMVHQAERRTRQALNNSRQPKAGYLPDNLPNKIKLLPKENFQAPRYSTLEGKRRTALMYEREVKRQKTIAAIQKTAYTLLSPIAEESDEENAGKGIESYTLVGEFHVCSHLYKMALHDQSGTYTKTAVTSLERSEFFRHGGVLALLSWLIKESKKKSKKPVHHTRYYRSH